MQRPTATDPRRALPALDHLLARSAVADLIGLYGRDLVRVQARELLDEIRKGLGEGNVAAAPPEEEIAGRLTARLEGEVGRPVRRVLNATGIFLHTNLGRAPLPAAVAALLPPLLDAYCDLEMDLDSGRRGDRNLRVGRLLRLLTGAEAALVANNNAASLVLALATLATDGEVVVSRGELVEIGGSFRIPDILRAAGSRLVEVGTTNRTRRADYADAIGERTALLLKVYPGNYRMSGFVESVEVTELVALGRERGVAVLVDEGSGLLRPHGASQLRDHPSLRELLAAGCDLVCGSGDKLLGGPQAGLLLGRREPVERCGRHPLYRALRPDRARYAALESVLRLHLAGTALPLEGLWPEPEGHRRRLEALAQRLGAALVPAEAFVGGGSAPERPVPGEALSLPGDERLLRRLRLGEPSVVAYVRDGRLILDLRTVAPEDDEVLVEAVRLAVERSGAD